MIERIFGKVDLGAVFQGLREVVADPASNLVLAVMLLSLVSLVLLILVVIVLFLFVGHQDEDEDEEEPVPDDDHEEQSALVAEETSADDAGAESSRRATLARRAIAGIGTFAIPLLLISSAVSGYVVTAQDDYCMRCHAGRQGKVESNTGRASGDSVEQIHGYVRCVACHEGNQATAFFGNTLDRLRHVGAFARGVREGSFATVPSDRCASCHEEVISRLVKDEDRGIKVSHAEPLEAGLQCRVCHPDVGHVPEERSDGMSVCVRCHDDKTAAADCSTCHFKDTAFAGSDNRLFTAQRLVGKGDCSGCHDQRSCDGCHGMRMPHSKDFVEGAHARLAGFEKKQACFRCHVEGEDCAKCHSVNTTGVWGHPPIWKSIHMNVNSSEVAGCGCHGRSPYVQTGQDYCLACHPPGIR